MRHRAPRSIALTSHWWIGALVAAAAARPLAAQTIDTVVVVSHNVFSAQGEALGPVGRLANALHVRTRPAVIRRTLLLEAGDPYDSARAVESERALRALHVFRQVRVGAVRSGERVALEVETADGWSTKPQLEYSSSGGDLTWQVGLVDDNLFGTATSLTALYARTPDRSSLRLGYANPHFIARRTRLATLYENLSDGERAAWRFGLPFYETAAPHALETSGEVARERVLVFRDGVLAATYRRRAVRLALAGGLALHASSGGYLRVWGGAEWRREDLAPETSAPFPRASLGAIGLGLEAGQARFRVLERFNSYARREDVDLSRRLRFGLWAVPRAWNYALGRTGLGPELRAQAGTGWRRGFAVLRADASGLFTSEGIDSGSVRGMITVASQDLPRQTAILHVEAAAQRIAAPRPGTEYDFWPDQTGPRLFGAHAFTGTRLVWIALEDRVLVSERVLGLFGIALTPFADWGGAWYPDEHPRLGGDAGLALRVGSTRGVHGNVTELAAGGRFGDGFRGGPWAVSVRHGLIF